MTNNTLYNFAYDQLPKNWLEYYGHPVAKALAKRFILEKPSQSLFISGESGVGKTAFVLLLLKSYLCLNRAEGSMNPCGKCRSCLDVDVRLADPFVTGVYWLQQGATVETSFNTEVNNALAAAEKGHVQRGAGEKDLLVIVCDEFQGFPRNIRQKLLHNAEVRNEHTNVCYIFLTMQEDVLTATERIAFKRRGDYLTLQPFTEEELVKFLLEKYPNCPEETAWIIAGESEFSPGLAISHYSSIVTLDPELDPSIAAYVLNIANNDQRLELWEHIEKKGSFLELRNKISRLNKFVNSKRLAQQLIEDIMRSADKLQEPTDNHIFAIGVLTQYSSNYLNCDLTAYLTQLYNMKLIDEEAVMSKIDHKLNYVSD